MKRVVLAPVAGLLVLAVVQVGIYNWRLALSMRHKDLTDRLRELEWRRDELLVDRATLTSPDRLGELGESLGLGPLPLERFRVVDLERMPTEGGEALVCAQR